MKRSLSNEYWDHKKEQLPCKNGINYEQEGFSDIENISEIKN